MDVFAALGHNIVGRHPIISAIGSDAGDGRLDLIQQRCHLRGIPYVVPGQGRGHDHSGVGVHGQVQLFPSATRLFAMFFLKPLAGTEDFESRDVD